MAELQVGRISILSALAPLAVLLSALAVASCSHAAERPILNEFFAASRLRDMTALRKLSTATFEPTSQGIITSFEIIAVGPDQHSFETARTLASKSSLVELSVDTLRHRVELKQYDGDLVTKEVTISAPVKLPNGQTAQKTLIVAMQRAILKGDKEIVGRWIITGVKTLPEGARYGR